MSASIALLVLELVIALLMAYESYSRYVSGDYLGSSLAGLAAVVIVYYLYNYALFVRTVYEKISLSRALKNSNARDIQEGAEKILFRSAAARVAIACVLAYMSKSKFEDNLPVMGTLIGVLAFVQFVESAAIFSRGTKASDTSRPSIKRLLGKYQSRVKHQRHRLALGRKI